MALREVEIETLTCEQVATKYQIPEARNVRRMCLRGATLARRYGGWSKVPETLKKTALQAKKVGKSWFIPVEEARRVFLP
jgi:hypothetical protein